MKKIINIHKNSDGNIVVSGRELHDALEVKTHYRDWIKRMISYGFTEGVDYVLVSLKNERNLSGGRFKNDVAMELDMAKEIAMIQRTEKGKQIRQYFIRIEKSYKSIQQPKPLSATQQLKLATQAVGELDDRVSKLEINMESNEDEKADIHELGQKLALKSMGGYKSNAYKEIGHKVYQRLWRNFNKHFRLTSYKRLPHVKYDEAIGWLKNEWHLDMDLKDEVEILNSQGTLF